MSETKAGATTTMWGEVEERGDGDTSEGVKSLVHVTVKASSHGLARLTRRHHVEIQGHAYIKAMRGTGCCDRQPIRTPESSWQGFRLTNLEASRV